MTLLLFAWIWPGGTSRDTSSRPSRDIYANKVTNTAACMPRMGVSGGLSFFTMFLLLLFFFGLVYFSKKQPKKTNDQNGAAPRSIADPTIRDSKRTTFLVSEEGNEEI